MTKIFKTLVLLSTLVFVFSCDDFEEININPLAASADQVEVEFFINNSIGGAQQDPHISERIFVLYWMDAGRTTRIGTLSEGYTNAGWTSDYYNGYVSKWLKDINSGVAVAESKITSGNVKEYTNNLLQIARIWRAYIMSEMSDNFGPIPVDGFQGKNPEYAGVKDVYYYMLKELDEAVSLMDVSITVKPNSALDPAYGYDYKKWKKYGNSLRMRLAMRLSEVDPAKAKAEFEDAVSSGSYIGAASDDFKVSEVGGWHSYVNVMSRQWNSHYISAAYRNLTVGLGSVTSADQLPANQHGTIKSADYMGLKFEDHFTSLTNDPSAGFWFDGLPNSVDPRAYKTFPIPGDLDNPEYNTYPSWSGSHAQSERDLLKDDGSTLLTIDAAFTWNAFAGGDWGQKGAKNKLRFTGSYPRLAHKFRGGQNDGRIFFASWESYFLMAEAAVRGWSVPMSGEDAYEAGIGASFNYFGVSGHLGTYLASSDYNNAGTSVSWGHTAEPPASVTKNYVDGYTSLPGSVSFTYPENTIYKGGTVKNDLLNKIITQKYIAQSPWLPLEIWNDHRRLGLPFFENPAVENPISNLPALNTGNVMTNRVGFFGQRLKYPASFENNIPGGHAQAVNLLEGPDEVHTPLWWAQKN